MKKITFLLILILVDFSVRAQHKFIIDPESIITISGTSTIHDWTSKVNTINGDITFTRMAQEKNMELNGKLVENLSLSIPVKSIESPRGPVMDNKTYEALKSDEFPDITFKLTDNKITGISDNASDTFRISVTGDLTIAGYTQTVELALQGQKLENGSFRFKGDDSFKMTEYNVKPPTAMFGQIICGDKITLAFNLLVNEVK